MFTQVQLTNSNLAPVKCYLRDDTKEAMDKDHQEDSPLDVNQNPFVSGSIVEDGELILRLWRDGRLAEYCGQCTSQSRHCNHEQVRATWVSQNTGLHKTKLFGAHPDSEQLATDVVQKLAKKNTRFLEKPVVTPEL